jgi:hypothetical protein
MILNTSEISSIRFSDVLESNASTLRRSVDGSKTFIKWDGTMPSWVNDLTTKEGPYTYTEILTILSTSDWVSEVPDEI